MALMHPWATDRGGSQPLATLAPRPFVARRDLPAALALIAVLAVAGVGVAGALPRPAVVLLAVYVAIAALSWFQPLLRTWAVGEDWIAVRRWIGWTHLRLDDIHTVDLDDADPFGQTIVFSGRRLRAVPVPLDHERSEDGFGQQLHELLERCHRRGTLPSELAARLPGVRPADPASTGARFPPPAERGRSMR